jgi:hypothetical protein
MSLLSFHTHTLHSVSQIIISEEKKAGETINLNYVTRKDQHKQIEDQHS